MANRKYQLTCPKCKYEFEYDNGQLDKDITRLGQEIHDIDSQIAEYKMLPYEIQKERSEWYKRVKYAKSCKAKELGELKAKRKISDQQIKHYEHEIFKRLVKDLLGRDAYMDLIDKMKEELEAYKISGLMWREYTRSNSKSNVTNINKL